MSETTSGLVQKNRTAEFEDLTEPFLGELLNELHKLRLENKGYKTQLAHYEKLHNKEKKELINRQAYLDKYKAKDLAESKLLQEVSRKLIEEENIERLYGQIIDTAKAVMHSDAVSMQVFIPERRALKLLAWRGFHPNSAQYWEWVEMVHGSTCALAMTEQRRIIVEDVKACDFLQSTEDLKYYALSNIRAVQSTPLISRSGDLLGMLSTHWSKPHLPSERDFALLDVIIRQAADLLERMYAKIALRENKSWLNGQKEAFQAAMSGQPLTVSLKVLIDTVVYQTDGTARAAFYQIPSGGDGLHHIVGMSEEYAQDINGLKVGPNSLACGLAMYTGEPVITPDVEVDPDWESLRPLARKYNCRACWSFPVRTKEGPIVGTLGIYFSQPRMPTLRELELAGVIGHAAAIIISREQELKERTKMETALRKREKQLKRLVRLRDEFISNAGHELNTPLTSLAIYAHLLEQSLQEKDSVPHTKMIKKLKVQVEHLRVLIRDMLDNTRLAEGKLNLNITCFNLNQLIREKIEDMQYCTKMHRLDMQLHIEVEIEADKARIGQVLSNLISNAIKYSPHGGKIVISGELMDYFIKVNVIDCGLGIPNEDLKNIFERFYRVLPNKSFPGLGIGLSICKEIIEMHRGTLEVKSQEGVGSTFSFIIPIRQNDL